MTQNNENGLTLPLLEIMVLLSEEELLMKSKRNFILNVVTAFIWLVAGIASVTLQGNQAGPCFMACIMFAYLAVNSYKKWKAENND